MKILVLDDEDVRHEAYERRYRGHEVHRAYTFRQFIRAITAHRFDVIQFDHDIGGDRDGFDCAKWMVQFGAFGPQDPRPRCIVHSWNPTGALRIFDLLHRAGFEVEHSMFSCEGASS